MAQELEIRLLGGVALALDGAALGPFMSAKAPALLAYLAVTGRPHRREALAGLLWGELPDAASANNLRQILTSLRKSLEPFLIATRETVKLNPARPYTPRCGRVRGAAGPRTRSERQRTP